MASLLQICEEITAPFCWRVWVTSRVIFGIVASKLVGEGGYVLGIDLKPVNDLRLLNVSSMVGDVEKLEGFVHRTFNSTD
jgi:hypothetical protein